MGYELHITRAKRHCDSRKNPIDLSEWLAYAQSSPTLTVGGWDGDIPIFSHVCGDGSDVSLTWADGEIMIKGYFTTDPANEFVPMATDLRANVLGDDDERYTEAGVVEPC
ncbi:hypothetical protein [Micromonospora sonneratiae]|uniref:Uncharacterized protein n=1 Tax=Micromonospora sonneratiae TaxID=1184706 RepID=A0ABW3YRR0_9ACTN